jgi:hypothetical protein
MNKCIIPEAAEVLKKKLMKGEITPDDIAKMLPEDKAQLKTILEDFVSDKMGVKVTAEETTFIKKQAKKIEEAKTKVGENLGNPEFLEDNLAFFKAKAEMDRFLLQANPASKLRVLTGTIGRGMMLASAKSPILNIGSNIEVGLTEALSRRLAKGGFKTTNTKLAKDYIKMNWKIYQETGYDMSRMMKMSDNGVAGGRVLDDIVHAQGPGAVRKTGQVVEDIVFKQLMGAPDAFSGAIHFADSVNIGAMRMAKGDTKLANELMTDAMRLDPVTAQGAILKAQANLDAHIATWTNKSWATKVTQGIRGILNEMSGDLRAGDYLLPFVKTPANVIATGMDYAGAGVIKTMMRTAKALKSGEGITQEIMQRNVRDMVRAGMGLTGAVVIAEAVGVDNYVGAYDPARKQIEGLQNSSSNSFKIGNLWVSTDWLGPLSVPFNAIMYAKKYGKSLPDQAVQFGHGVLTTAMQLPGVKDVVDFASGVIDAKPQTAGEATGAAVNEFVNQVSARLIPSGLGDLAKATDPFVRQVAGDNPLAGIANKIPGLNQTLPAKRNVFGEETKAQPWYLTIGFGARVKEANNDPVVKEIDKVIRDSGSAILFTDWDKSASKTLAQFKQSVGATTYDKAKIEYGQKLKSTLSNLFSSSAYKNASDDQKQKYISNADAKAIDIILKNYSFKYKSNKSSSNSSLLNALNEASR